MTQSPSLTYIGHATILIEMDGQRILTDPILRNRVSLLRRRGQAIDAALVQNLDAVLISHLHYDHLDLPSLRLLGHNMRLIVPHGSARLFYRYGFRFVEELQVGDTTSVGELTLTATYAKHSRSRHPFGLRTQCLGFIIAGSYQIYFPGDTDLFPEMVHLADNLDVALLPVWGWGPTLGPGHMDPLQAAKTLPLLRPRLAIPIHWGSLYLWGLGKLNSRRFLTEPPHAFARYAASLAPEVKTIIVEPGGTISLGAVLNQGKSGE
ncbi:MAG: MBL fold metallo-hydrolase [Chloroflexi bacterium]|nr:MBL fold metallo-hydrolase [Chloroflexota bacterium]